VLLVGNWAIKFPSCRSHGEGVLGMMQSLSRGISANISELVWSGMPGLCPVEHSLFGIVNIYPRCQEVSEVTSEEYEAIGHVGPTDKKPQNVGLLGGKLVWIDYDMSWNDRPICEHIRN
jgi:hypothetical protein